jgi:hypothetical protein
MEVSWSTSSKTVYAAPAHPTLDREAFGTRWRAHGDLAMRLSIWTHACRYMQCDAPPGLDVRCGLPRTSDACWGVGLVWLRSVDALRAMTSDPEFPLLYDDEPEAFGGQVEHFMLLAREAVAWEDAGTQVKLVAFLEGDGDPATSDERWRAIERWASDARRSARGARGAPTKLVLSRRLDATYVGLAAGADGTVQTGAVAVESTSSLDRFGGLVELGFASVEDAARHVAASGGRPLAAGWADDLGSDAWWTVVTTERPLYDEAA